MAENKTFKFKNPNTGIVSEYRDTPYFRKMTARIQKKYDNLSAKDKATIKERIAKRNERQSKQDKMRSEVREGRAAGLTMTEIRAKRMNISADELKKRQLATVLGMAEGMSMFLPAGAAIKAGQLVYKGLKGARAAKALKAAAKANRASKGGKQSTRVTVSDAQKAAGRRPKKNEVIEGTAVEKSSKRVKPPARTTARTTKEGAASKRMPVRRPRSDVKKPGTGVMEIRRAGTSPRGMKRVQGSDRPTPKPAVRGPASAKKGLTARQKALLAGAAAVGAGTAAYLAGDKDKAVAGPTRGGAASKRMPTPKPKSTTKPTPKPKRRGTPPLGGPSGGPKKGNGTTKKNGRPPLGGPSGGAKPKKISAGANTGFGPKGNIFPSNAKERAALMLMYGGTGSAAAKAAAAGKQGDLKAGKAAYEKAKKDRRAKKK